MDNCQELETKLAVLLGWTQKMRGEAEFPLLMWVSPDGAEHATPLKWCRDWNACGPLMVEHQCYPFENGTGSVVVRVPRTTYTCSTIISPHPDKNLAVMITIVQAVIAKLEAHHG